MCRVATGLIIRLANLATPLHSSASVQSIDMIADSHIDTRRISRWILWRRRAVIITSGFFDRLLRRWQRWQWRHGCTVQLFRRLGSFLIQRIDICSNRNFLTFCRSSVSSNIIENNSRSIIGRNYIPKGLANLLLGLFVSNLDPKLRRRILFKKSARWVQGMNLTHDSSSDICLFKLPGLFREVFLLERENKRTETDVSFVGVHRPTAATKNI
mmetsp:Transcript_36483/g.79761  ORF Transcript_36483/g.79761 Transcript_36483/m.79761 type:complete len:213 (+) Transcript_36483:491-1129(+)